jgi:N-acetylneuraminate synthase/sialic acid synthase
MRDLLIGGRRIADDTDAYVIADVAHGPLDELERIEVLFLRAAVAGAHAVLLGEEALRPVTRGDLPDGEPNGRRTGPQAQRAFGQAEYARVAEIAADLNLDLVPTAFDGPSINFLRAVSPAVPAVRIGPDRLTDLELVAAAASLGRPLLLAVLDAAEEQVRTAVDAARAACPEWTPRPQVALLQCAEPDPQNAEDLNMARLIALLAGYPDLVVGYTGRHVCPEQSWIAYAVGARIVEKRISAERQPKARRWLSFDPLGLVRYDGRSPWGDDSTQQVKSRGRG